jgi:hypothetical protein
VVYGSSPLGHRPAGDQFDGNTGITTFLVHDEWLPTDKLRSEKLYLPEQAQPPQPHISTGENSLQAPALTRGLTQRAIGAEVLGQLRLSVAVAHGPGGVAQAALHDVPVPCRRREPLCVCVTTTPIPRTGDRSEHGGEKVM